MNYSQPTMQPRAILSIANQLDFVQTLGVMRNKITKSMSFSRHAATVLEEDARDLGMSASAYLEQLVLAARQRYQLDGRKRIVIVAEQQPPH